MIKIGSHVGMKAPNYLLGAVKEAMSYDANSFMIYSGAPQNTRRVDMEKYKVDEAYELLKSTNIKRENIILHAPYIINLANSVKQETFDLAVNFLIEEVKRAQYLNIDVIVLHPGSHVGEGVEIGTKKIIEGLNLVTQNIDMKNTIIALETMAGKGSEIGKTFQELKEIIDGLEKPQNFGICLDTCHIHDAGYDLSDFDNVLNDFDNILGLDLIKVVHLNDSKNDRGASKDRHENIGKGKIGFEKLYEIAHHKKLTHVPKILETPYVDKKPLYKEEIIQLKKDK